MPIYEYHCDACGYEFEALVPFAHADDVNCESCGSARVTRLASSFCSSQEGSGGSEPAPACGGGG